MLALERTSESRPRAGTATRSRLVRPALLGALALLFAAGCETSPLGVATVTESPDSVRYTNTPGTPYAVATVWKNGTVNVACEVHDFVHRSFPSCFHVARGTVAYRGRLLIGQVTGNFATEWSPDFDVLFTGGSMTGTLLEDTLTVETRTNVATPCGEDVLVTNLILVRAIPEVP